MFRTVLVANRGEIACRIIAALRGLGVRSVAVFTDVDAAARHVRLADDAVAIGSARAYLSVEAIIDAARRTGAEAIHPGYGFLAENADLARACAAAGVTFIGPGIGALEIMGDKIRSKTHVAAHGVAVVPGVAREGATDDELLAAATEIGFPLLIKPSAGGGGKGMHVVAQAGDLPAALERAKREAAGAFGSSELLLERLITRPRHIEVQVLADTSGHVIHLGERECSLQRRHQKVIEEAPSPLLDPDTRERIGRAAIDVARSVDYVGAGTVEFILSADAPDEFFFMEMNTRLQVEHPVTEMVTGVDLVHWQVRIAAGERLTLAQEDVALTGHAIEARVYAEDPNNHFLPTGGRVLAVREPRGDGIRIDSALVAGLDVTPDYDPLLAKIIAHGADRDGALRRLDRALAETAVLGIGTNIDFLRQLLADDEVRSGDLDTGLIGRLEVHSPAPDEHARTSAAMLLHARTPGPGRWAAADGWRLGEAAPIRYVFEGHPPVSFARADLDRLIVPEPGVAHVTLGGVVRTYAFAISTENVYLAREGTGWEFTPFRATNAPPGHAAADSSPELRSPMPGTVVALEVASDQEVAEGEAIVVVEAMKMEHVLRAPHAGRVRLHVAAGEHVTTKEPLATITPAGTGNKEAP